MTCIGFYFMLYYKKSTIKGIVTLPNRTIMADAAEILNRGKHGEY